MPIPRSAKHTFSDADDQAILALYAQTPIPRGARTALAARLGCPAHDITVRAATLREAPAATPTDPPPAPLAPTALTLAPILSTAADAAPPPAAGGNGVVLSFVSAGRPYAQLGAASVPDLEAALHAIRDGQ